MATAYTALLGLALPVTGELSGSWGDTVNVSITSLLDSAISGTTTLNTDADVTLTTSTGVANQSRQAIILWNPASGTVTRNITAPAQSKIYTVINASGGTQSIVIRGAGPTTGVTVLKGESAQVAWNGSDFVKISSSAGDVTVRNLTVTGTLSVTGVATLGAGAVLNTPASVTLTNATGLPIATGVSGLGTGVATALAVNVGSAGAPVLFNGALGTPSSGTVTNLTGTASININGTVGATTANTGAFTTLSASGTTTLSGNQVISVTDNTNAALRITQLGTGNALVVEDSANPDASPFVINADGRVISGFATSRTTAVGEAQVQINGGTAPLSLIRQADATTAINLEFAKARASGAIVASGDTIGRLYFSGSDGTAQIPAAYIDAAVDGTPGLNDMPGRLVFSTTADGAATPTERMRIDSAGRLYLGTTSASPAGIKNSWPITGAATAYGQLSTGTVQPDVTSGATGYYSNLSIAAASTLSSLYHFRAQAGTIGAGSTIANQYGFYIGSGFTEGTNNYGFYSNIAAGTGRYNFYAAGTADNYFAGNLILNGGTANGVPYLNGSKVLTSGSALTFDDTNLGVAGDIQQANATYLKGKTAAGTATRLFGINFANSLYIGAIDTTIGDTLFVNNGSERMRITPTGNVGIGTSSPTNTLSVTGNANITGNTTLGDASTDTVTMNGYMGVGQGGLNSTIGIYVTHTALTGSTQTGVYSTPTGTSSALSRVVGFSSQPKTADTAFTCADVIGLFAQTGTKGAASTVTNWHGVYISDQTQGTNNYGITSLVSSGTNKWNIYASGTAANYFAGNVGIGTSSPDAGVRLTVAKNDGIIQIQRATGSAYPFSFGIASDGRFNIYNGTTASESLAITQSGNLGLGVTPSAWGAGKSLEIGYVGSALWTFGPNEKYSTNGLIYNAGWKYSVTGSVVSTYSQQAGNDIWFKAASGTAGNAAILTQAMTLDASGNLLVGTTSAGTDKVRIAAPQTSYNNIGLVSTDDTNSGGYIAFRNSATTEIGSIKRNGASAVSYNTTSDHRLKTVLGSVTDSGARIDALEPIEYEWKADGSRTRGFLAHKFQEVYAGSVTGTKDAVDKDGKPVYQAMQAGSSEVIADLVAEIQSLRKRLAAAGI